MTDDKTREQINRVLFSNLVIMLSSSAMQQLGKLVNPATGKAEVNLEGAQVTIDMLSMLRDRTKGNLLAEEEKMLGDILSSLQLNYVETSSTHVADEAAAGHTAEDETPAGTATGDAEEAAPEDAEPAGDGNAAGKAEPREPKFRKSYG